MKIYKFLTISGLLTSTLFAQSNNVIKVIEERHSGKEFDTNKDVSKSHLSSLVEAARLSASCFNDQSWNFIICDRNQSPDAYQKAFNTLVEVNQQWAKNAPVLIVIVASSSFKHNQQPNRWAQYDTGSAAAQMSLQATALGLMTHQMGGFDEKKTIEVFHIPTGYTPMAIMAVGYEVDNAKQNQRDRLPISSNFFEGSWGKAFSSN